MKIKICLLPIIRLSLLLAFMVSTSLAGVKNILYLNSYHHGYAWSDQIEKVFSEHFQNRKGIEFYLEYLDSYRLGDHTSCSEIFERKFEHIDIDLFLLSDDAALECYLKNESLHTIPGVYVGINNHERIKSLPKQVKLYGILETLPVEKNIQLIQTLHKPKTVYLFHDSSSNGKVILEKTLPLFQKAGMNVLPVNIDQPLQIDPLKGDVFFLLTLFSKRYSFSMQSVVQNLKTYQIPMYSLWNFYLGKGIVGGYVLNATHEAQKALVYADLLLNGSTPHSNRIESAADLRLDWEVFHAFELDESLLPSHIHFINQPEAISEVSFHWIVLLGFIMLMQSAMAFYLIRQNRSLRESRLQGAKSNDLLIKQSKYAELGEMMNNIIHQWKQPLNAINMSAFRLKREESQSERAVIYEEVMDQTKIMEQTIRDFRDFFRGDKVKQEFSLISLFDSTLFLIHAAMEYSDIDIQQDHQGDIMIDGYENELKHALVNIFNNAREAILEKRIKDPYLRIESFHDNDQITIRISDNAGGIRLKNPDDIFRPYTSTKKDGTGIGMYITRQIIEKHKGSIFLENSNHGATFIIKLPIGENEHV